MEPITNVTANDRPEIGCFWHAYREIFGEPNIHWCEKSVCGLIEQPATTWSNLAIIFVGGWILVSAAANHMKKLGWSILLMGIFSFIYHASNNWASQILDFFGMYLYTSLLITFNFLRLKKIKPSDFGKTYLLTIMLNLVALPLFHYILLIKIQYLVLINILILISLEWAIRKKDQSYSLKYYWPTLGFIFAAQLCSLMDGARIYCNPENDFIHGHALWHVLGAISQYYSYLFYREIKMDSA